MKFVKAFNGARFADLADEINRYTKEAGCEVVNVSLTYDDFDGYYIALCVLERRV